MPYGVGTFLRAILDHWVWLTGLVLMVEPLLDYHVESFRGWADKFVSRKIRSRLAWTVSISTLFVACFLAFQDQLRRTETAQEQRSVAAGERDEARRASQAPRRHTLSSADKATLLPFLQANVPPESMVVRILCPVGDTPGCLYGQEWVALLGSAGWKMSSSFPLSSIFSPPLFGVHIRVHDVKVPGGATLQQAFAKIGLEATGEANDQEIGNLLTLIIASEQP